MRISNLKKYLFGLVVITYVITVIGIPVYYHYCGGELEEINYVLKGSNCCGDDDSQEENDGCCKNESHVLKSNIDFTFKTTGDYVFLKDSGINYSSLPFKSSIKRLISIPSFVYVNTPPSRVQHSLVISTSVLRI
ncbi:HYC_CC_PP family protein [Aurantibacillus circumpalustris]|uniref:HYC_CC_PP family protein n=1 Tax=Aurantibacillus circumpalustris TaxID=3036359 RepID=UPI00295B880A|nr:hypothetical protein [Aurantibacillus circumpalustris]